MWFKRNGHREAPTLVLSGGGAMGALQVGVLRVLVRRGFRPSRIVGTSVGALNGAFLAFYPDEAGVAELTGIWHSLENERFIHFNPVRVAFRLAARRNHLFNNDFLKRLVATHAVVDDFSATEVPLYVTATNLNTGRKEVLSTGSVSQAVLASTAIPGVFSPVEINGHAYLDGGVVSNLDLETAVDLGAREILGIDLSHCFALPEPRNVFDVLTRTVDIVMRERVQRDMAELGSRAKITVLQPEIEGGPGVGELRNIDRLIERGERFGEQAIDRCFDAKGRLQPGVVTASVAVPT
ncbi:MAG: patatin-like phospholipase family protein [Dehalococcoidia bacterium]|nr:patatin-like phospholipase family protein [Dehalococcoidia bacterium]